MLRPRLWIFCAAALLGSAAAQEFAGDMTSFTLGSPSTGNCNYMFAPAAAAHNYAAINSAQWAGTKNCGRCAHVSCADSRCSDTTKSEIVYILDQCPECKQGDLDVSPTVFKELTGSDPSRYKIKWKFVDCPVAGNLKYCLKTGSNAYYAAIQPANSAAGIKSMTINSQTTSMVPSAYYYLLESTINLSSVKVSVTSLSGETVTDTVSLTAGQCATGTSQFTGSGSATTPTTPVATPSTAPAPVPTTKSPASPTPPAASPNPTTKRPQTPSPTPTKKATPAPPRTETTKTPSPSNATAADAKTDTDGDDEDNYDDVDDATTTAPVTTSPATTPATTSAPTATATTPAATTATPAATTAAPAANATTTTTPAPAATTKAPVAPSTPRPTKKVSCRRLED